MVLWLRPQIVDLLLSYQTLVTNCIITLQFNLILLCLNISVLLVPDVTVCVWMDL